MKRSLEEYLNKRDITGVVFDIDNTLLATGEYYNEQIRQLSLKLAPKFKDNTQEEFVEGVNEAINKVFFERKLKPILIYKIYLQGLSVFLGEDIPRNLEKQVKQYFKDFYTVVPTPYRSVPNILKTFLSCNVKIILHSHAQEDWTKLKTDYLSKLLDYDLKYFATPITEDKNKDSWLKAFEKIPSKPENVLVVGDNFYADILPSIEAGSKYLTWIDRHKQGLEDKDLSKDDIELVRISDIGEILDSLK
jgi:FMN phosphatase YigB (HAD superfamily)